MLTKRRFKVSIIYIICNEYVFYGSIVWYIWVTYVIWYYIVLNGSYLCYCDVWQLSVVYGSILWYMVVKVVTSFQIEIIKHLPYTSYRRFKVYHIFHLSYSRVINLPYDIYDSL